MDVAEPPRIVVESRASCGDADRIEELLRSALVSARAPRRAWTVKMSVDAKLAAPAHAAGSVRAEGTITDENGIQVADRILSVPASDCRGLARAVGVWASLVLEQEVARSERGGAPASVSTAAVADPEPDASLWPAPMPAEKAPPERDWYLHHDESRDLEIGMAGFLMAGAGAGAMAGASPYAILETGHGVFLRPALAFGEAMPPLNTPPVIHAILVVGRLDTCLRLPGLYTQNRGMQLDMCGGADVGLLDDVSDRVRMPYVSIGPSLDLRGELGSFLSTAIRGVAGVNLTSGTDGPMIQPLWSGRLELAFSWKVK